MKSVFYLLVVLQCSVLHSQEIVDTWTYTFRKPEPGWQVAAFDDAQWEKGNGGFGTSDTPGSRVGTTWETNNIWLRKSFELTQIPAKPALLIHHDENAQVYLNGQQVAALEGFTSEFIVIPIPSDKVGAVQVGRNILAVHCNQTAGGQFIDAHVIDATRVPELPIPKRDTKPFLSELITQWGAEVTAENAWTEYPRPQLKRDNWTNLNGYWEYAVTPIAQRAMPAAWSEKILVPYCLESKLGGVQRLLDSTEALWYHRNFQWAGNSLVNYAASSKPATRRTLLNFDAVDYRCEVFVNGKSVGQHVGGNTPFSFDISGAVQNGDNELVVRVEDATEEYQLRGKQVLNARGIWYTQSSGIWQTVWLEEVPTVYAEQIKIETKLNGEVAIKVITQDRATSGLNVEAIARLDGREVARATGSADRLALNIPAPRLWSPDSPTLYELEIRVNDDVIHSYFGVREVGKVLDANGHWRFTLNGKIIFHWGPLDQGWWPDGLLTPPSDAAMLFDIEWLKSAGFNMIRKHIKVEPRRYYYHCDRVGMLVWQDQVSGGTKNKAWPEWTRLQPDPVDATWPPEQHTQFMAEFDAMIGTLENHPSIVCWVPFNEAWGQHKTLEVGKWTAERDPSRSVNIASGGNFWPVGDIVDEHRYPDPGFPFELDTAERFKNFIHVMGEFGGHGLPVQGHLWDANRRNWGYGSLPKDEAEYRARYVTSLKKLNELRSQGIAAGVYTQTTDVEGEVNGLMTYDRKVIKIPANELAELHKILFAAD